MPDLSHLWQRFMLASALIFGVLIGVASTVFGYSNVGSVDVRWSILHIDGVPLWTVAIVPLAVVLVAGTLYHWYNGLHHFTEHMRHRRRVHELEAEVATLRGHLDHVLEMPDQSSSRLPARHITADPAPAVPVVAGPALTEPAAPNGSSTEHRPVHRKRAVLGSETPTERAAEVKKSATEATSEPSTDPAKKSDTEPEPAAKQTAEPLPEA